MQQRLKNQRKKLGGQMEGGVQGGVLKLSMHIYRLPIATQKLMMRSKLD